MTLHESMLHCLCYDFHRRALILRCFPLQVLQLLPRLTKLDNDDVTSQERSNAEDKPDVCQTVSKVPPASPGPLPAQDTPAMASPALGLNPALEQVHMPADLQAALEPFPVVCATITFCSSTWWLCRYPDLFCPLW